jgi:two-component system, OmpR family, response regulator
MKNRILVVDDNAMVSTALRRGLEATGNYEVREENDPTQVVRVATEFVPDLILMDIMMPQIDGPEVARRIQADAKIGRTPIMFQSSIIGPNESRRAEVAGKFPVIAKSSIWEMVDAVERHVEQLAAAGKLGSQQRG